MSQEAFDIVGLKRKASIVYAADGYKLDSIAAFLLANDIEKVTGYRPQVTSHISKITGNAIIIGSIHSHLIKSLKAADFKNLDGKWECYSHQLIRQPFKNIRQALVIAGSDARGTAYGVFSISEKLGVSPWYWWADVHPEKKKLLTLNIRPYTSLPPAVKFRGIFINDEDWGLQPWAAKTFEPETGDIGPKTYAKVFELLLRLKANLIWPAMHPSTKAFFHYPGNPKVAEDYQIVIGSSHAEPMLRNNVGEWNEKTLGHFNYLTNKEGVYQYWEDRVKESKGINAMYTIGMRGVHDSQMEGVKNAKEAVPLLERIFKDQRDMLSKYLAKDATAIPQVFTAYKEVLEVYDQGLNVPEDVTLVWPDDNYGYIQRLNNEKEASRKGGSGVYYHASYWGRPHDYLWLSSTHPSLIREEMMKAYETGSDRLWVLNVGDIKPLEYNIQLFMDMAYQAAPFKESSFTKKHLQQWHQQIFGNEKAGQLTDVMWRYYQLAFERRPEFMGWSRTEPTTKTSQTAYNPIAYGDQIQKRIDAYERLEKKVKDLSASIADNRKEAYYELVEYPVRGASLMNKKFLYRDKAEFYAHLGGLNAQQYAQLSDSAYRQIQFITEHYNSKLAKGKWNGIMSMAPRKLPVFDPVTINLTNKPASQTILIIPESGLLIDSAGAYRPQQKKRLPAFDRWNQQQYFIDLTLLKDTIINYTIRSSASWIKLPASGTLSSGAGQSYQRIAVDIDWAKAPKKQLNGSVIIHAAGHIDTIEVVADNRLIPKLENYKGFIASNDHIAINATSFSVKKESGGRNWKVIEGLGSAGRALEAGPFTLQPVIDAKDTAAIRRSAAVQYEFYTFHALKTDVTITTLPTFPLNSQQGMRYAVSIDNGSIRLLDFKTVGRSEEWKKNVLSNTAQKTISTALGEGKHTITIYMIDPGVILDRLFINLGNPQPFYGALPETTRNFLKK